jgi:hypothetical protein
MRLLAIWLLSVTAAAQSYPPPFPRPNATKLMETDRLVIWNIVWPKGEPSPLHQHVYDQVGTYYHPGGRVITDIKGEKRTGTTNVGQISTTRKGTLHIEEGTTDPPLRAVFIEMKHDTPSGQTDAIAGQRPPFPRDGATQVLDTERVTIWDFTPIEGARTTYRHPRETVIVWLGTGTVQWTPEGGTATTIAAKPGLMRYYTRGTAGTETIVEGTPRAMVFEFK